MNFPGIILMPELLRIRAVIKRYDSTFSASAPTTAELVAGLRANYSLTSSTVDQNWVVAPRTTGGGLSYPCDWWALLDELDLGSGRRATMTLGSTSGTATKFVIHSLQLTGGLVPADIKFRAERYDASNVLLSSDDLGTFNLLDADEQVVDVVNECMEAGSSELFRVSINCPLFA